MKKLILAVSVIFLTSSMIHAAPFLVCDPQADVTEYKLTGPAWVPATVPAEPDGSIKLDVADSLVGNNDITISGCWTSVNWGEQCSDPVPFAFTRPARPEPPGGVKLEQ